MSLDLSADFLVTDKATVPATIQRLGRLNRRAKEKSEPTKPFVVIEPDNHLPYTPADLDAAGTWLAKLPANEISQKQLAEAWEQSGDHMPALVASAWLDGGPTTAVTELREASPGITVLMVEDVDRVRASPKKLGRYVLPMPPPPRQLNWREWSREHILPIAPSGSIIYDRKRGAEWQS
jgi:CRISPR-associated endonuclease/helicase Cas3